MKKIAFFILFILLGENYAVAETFDCNEKYCKGMSSCEEAVYKLDVCKHKQLDRDDDGIPCEVICGDLKRESGRALWSSQGGKIPKLRGSVGDAMIFVIPPECEDQKTCKQMRSCADVALYLNKCKNAKLGANEEKMPCPRLCKN